MSQLISVDQLAKIGGVFSLLVFIHFFSDWIFQSHMEAMAKAKNARIRARHCAIYTTFFLPFLWWAGVSPAWIAGCAGILFLSHFVEDTYIPVYLWMKYIRRPPGMGIKVTKTGQCFYATTGPEYIGALPVRQKILPIGYDTNGPLHSEASPLERAMALDAQGKSPKEIEEIIQHEEFLKFVDTPLGKILLIAVDQIIHIAFLIPIAWVIAR